MQVNVLVNAAEHARLATEAEKEHFRQIRRGNHPSVDDAGVVHVFGSITSAQRAAGPGERVWTVELSELERWTDREVKVTA